MTAHQLPQSETIPKKANHNSIRFWVIIPFLVFIIFSALAATGYLLLKDQFSSKIAIISFLLFLAITGSGLLFTREITRRIKRVTLAAEQVARGDLSIRIEDDNEDEIGRLVKAFNQMVTNLEQLHQSRDILSRTMSPKVRQSLIENGLDFRGIKKTVAILFVDIRGFTRLTEKYSTEQLIFFLNDYYTTIANQVHSGDGIIGKYGGDSILAYFGALDPEPPAKSAMSALLTAMALQDAIEIMNDRWDVLDLPPIRVGIGITIGPVVAGPIGDQEQFEYTVIGDSVNLAARLQDLTRNLADYGIMISAEVYQALEESIKEQIQVISADYYESLSKQEKARQPLQFVDLGQVVVKGRRGPVNVYGIPDPGGD